MLVPRTLVTKLLNDETELCISDAQRLTNALFYIIKVHIGINPDILPKNDKGQNLVILECLSMIKDRYMKLTFLELNLSFSERIIDKKQGVSLTPSEIMAYIEDFNRKARFIKFHQKEEMNKADEEIRLQEEQQKFKQDSIELYKECLEAGIWTGDIYQSTAIARDCFASQMSEETKKEKLFPLANKLRQEFELKRKEAEANDENNFTSFVPVPTKEQLFAHAMVIYACQNFKPVAIN